MRLPPASELSRTSPARPYVRACTAIIRSAAFGIKPDMVIDELGYGEDGAAISLITRAAVSPRWRKISCWRCWCQHPRALC
jgi:hypothetical protein